MKNYFQLCLPYRFEWNDVFALANFINTLLVTKFGLAVCVACMIDDVIEVRRINLTFLHFSIAILNSYFLLMYYGIL